MSRTFRHTTALAAMIAVAAPQIGTAQQRIPVDAIGAHRAATEAARPDQAATLAQELAGGLTAEGLACSDGGTAPACALVTPEGVAVVLGEDDSILLAPDGEAAPEPEPEATPEPEAAPEPEPEAAAEPEPETAAEAVPEPAPETEATEADADTASEPAPEADAPAADAVPSEAAADESTAGVTVPEETAAEEPAPEETAPEEPAANEPATEAATEAASAEPGADTEASEAPDADALATLLAGAGAPVDDTPPEARAGEPDEAAAIAAEAEIPVAAALDIADDAAPADAGEAFTVTEGAARTSAEDFATSVAAATKATQEAAPRDNSERDLARALLAGLAGYAVGQAVGDHGQVALNSGDRVVITRQDGSQQVLKDDSALMFQPGSSVQTQNFEDGSSRIVVTREDGSRVVTIRDANLRVLRRTLIHPDGSEVKLIDDTTAVAPVQVSDLPPPARPAPPPALTDEAALRRALEATANQSRRFTLGQIRDIAGVRALVAPVNIDAITFDTGSAAIKPDQARQLASLGRVIADYVRRNPGEIFLVEGYTDTVGSDAMNLALSDRRAESLALALTEYFGVPPENLVVQGYGERFLKVPVEGDIRENRRVAVRRITDLLARN